MALEARAAMFAEASMPGARDDAVAAKWGISSKTIQRMRSDRDPAWLAAVARAWEKVDPYEEIARALVVLVNKATELALMARSPRDLRAVRDLIGCLGELQVSRDAFAPKALDEADRKDPSPTPPGESPRAAAS